MISRISRLIAVAAILALMVACTGCLKTAVKPGSPSISADSLLSPHVPGQVVARVKEGVDPSQLAALVGAEYEELPRLNAVILSLPQGKSVSDAIQTLKNSGAVAFAEPNYLRFLDASPNDALFEEYLWGIKRVQAPSAWSVTQGEGRVIAIVDTGVDAGHPDLAGKVLRGYSAPDGKEDELFGVRYSYDVHGHGTHCAGTAAAWGNNGIGVVGVAPKALILPVRVFAGAGGTPSTMVADGIMWAAQNGADVISLSLGGWALETVEAEAIDYALTRGISVVASSGNDYKLMTKFPAGYPGVIAVGAMNGRDQLTTFSTRGSHLSVVAPGQEIMSTVPGGDYESWDGTSMACPHVSGAVALIKAAFPAASPAEIKSLLESTADDLGPAGFDLSYGHGVINVARALGTPIFNYYGIVEVTANIGAYLTVMKPSGGAFGSIYVPASSGGTVRFHNVPEGNGYIVVSSLGGNTAQSQPFNVIAGQVMAVSVLIP